VIERQAVAVNFVSLPGVPGRSYVLDIHEITLVIERQDDEGRAPIAADLQARLDQVRAEEEQRQRIRRGQRNGTRSL
jgi:hypothetical protein